MRIKSLYDGSARQQHGEIIPQSRQRICRVQKRKTLVTLAKQLPPTRCQSQVEKFQWLEEEDFPVSGVRDGSQRIRDARVGWRLSETSEDITFRTETSGSSLVPEVV
jgi:hypothetical protein